MSLIDPHGRTINYLRLSITDRCNMRCTYCMPAQGISKVSHHNILSYEELLRIARAAVVSGIEKIRITGGEPLVRKGVIGFLESLAAISGLRHLVLTTNGALLGGMAQDLRDAGVQRLNVSLDSLQPETFSHITRCGDLQQVLTGIEKARKYGLPVKINAVVMRGINDREVEGFVDLAIREGCTVRFIEYMPAIRNPGWRDLIVPGSEILARIEQRHTLLPLEHADMAGPARNFRIAGTHGTIGIITPVSEHFCSQCNRIRVTSTGHAKGCLFADTGVDLRPTLLGEDDLLLIRTLQSIVAVKPTCHLMNPAECHHHAFSMASIGG